MDARAALGTPQRRCRQSILGETMQILVFLNRWIEVLAALFTNWRALSQTRKSIVVTREEGRFVVRRPGSAANVVFANISPGTQVPSETAEALRNRFISFELAADKVVTRRITVPAQAQEFLPGIVRNQIERLSPWPPAQATYGFSAKPNQDDAGTLDVCVLIAARASIDAICDELTASGLPPDRIAVRTDTSIKSAPLTLWTRATHAPQRNVQSLPRMIGIGLAAVVLLSAVASLWAVYSANSIGAEHDEVAERTKVLQRQSQSKRKPQEIASLKPPERAWALKETSPLAVLVLDDLAHALPDSAYLAEFRLENTTLRIIGQATDAPSLIAALEQSGHFSEVHFFAPTTKGPDGGLYKFYIEARAEKHTEVTGD
jgi:general secretion pathway protein L